jgi:hypothetical protein
VATRSHPLTHPLDATSLVDVLAGLLDPANGVEQLVIGIEPTCDHLDLHLAPLPDDDRAGAAGLFCMRAAASWCAVGATFSGRARHMESLDVVGSAEALVVVDRCGRVASALHVDGEPVLRPTGDSPGPVVGLTIDALHRMLGLPSPGTAPAAPLMALAVWSQLIILHTLERGSTSWAEAVLLHPGEPGGRRRHQDGHGVDASVETVVEATLRTEGGLSWDRVHRRACAGHGAADLTPEEVAWMDPVLYGRWVLGGLPDPQLAAEMLVAHGEHRTAESLLAVADAVVEQVGPMNLG